MRSGISWSSRAGAVPYVMPTARSTPPASRLPTRVVVGWRGPCLLDAVGVELLDGPVAQVLREGQQGHERGHPAVAAHAVSIVEA